MFQFGFRFAAIALLAMTAYADPAQHPILKIGSSAPDFALPGIDGKVHKLSDYSASPVLAVLFTCNHCPVAQMYENRIKQLVADYKDRGVAFVAISSNDVNALLIGELRHSDTSDTLAEMKIRAVYRHFNFPYLYDGDKQTVADEYGPQATPHIFIFDRDRKLQYQGRIDDNRRESLVKTHDARNAIDALLAGKPVPVQNTPVMGCSTKWKEKESLRAADMEKIAAEPVRLEDASVDDLKKLRQNPTNNYVLVNLWATWCGPCLGELADLEYTWRMFKSRPFDLVTVSTNLPDEKEGVGKALQEQHITSRNLLFASTDTDKVQAIFDPKWAGAVPLTMLIAPGGKVVYEVQGDINPLELRRAILAVLPDPEAVGNREYWATK
ncbi:MAG: redoxin domain-containing protein [Bryobacteraceae bacterium]|jgi:peroxiredoxin